MIRSGPFWSAAALALLAFLCWSGCSGRSQSQPLTTSGSQPPPAPASPIRFESVGKDAGLDFRLSNKGKSPLTILETTGGGAAFLDFDGDGWDDILLVGPHNAKLYHNEKDGKFTDATSGSGIARDKYWMGCAVGDYDGDGRPDIFLTGYRCFALYRNLGGGRFKDVTATSGVGGLDWSLSGAFADFNGDERVDLFVSQYLKFDETTMQVCQVGTVKSACGPEVYTAIPGKLFLNQGGGKFRSVPWTDSGKTWGALASDLLDQGRPQLYLANDMVPADLWSLEGGKWKNIGPSSGTAFDAQGHVQGGMGVDSADYNNDLRLDLLVTTFFALPNALYRNDGDGLFTEVSSPTRLGPFTMPYVGFGTTFSDFDNDGWLDLVITNGHVRDNVPAVDSAQTYAQPIQFFRNRDGKFTEVSASSGVGSLRAVGRGLSVADYDRDGRTDVLICDLEGEALLLRNVSDKGHWLQVTLSAPGQNRHGAGAMLTLEAGGKKQIREVRTCGSVLSSQPPFAHFGLGSYSGPCKLTVRWPNRMIETVDISKVDQRIAITPESWSTRTR